MAGYDRADTVLKTAKRLVFSEALAL
jgi:hypothetical protein